MTQREIMINALNCKAPIKGTKVPHFELVFFLTMEALGRVHPAMRIYSSYHHLWDSMSEKERNLHRKDMVDIQIKAAEKYEQNGIMLSACPWGAPSELLNQLEIVREMSGDEFFLATSMDPTFAIPDGDHMEEFIYRIADEPDKVKAEAENALAINIDRIEKLSRQGLLDGVCMCSDYCYNMGPFLSPSMFEEFITPYLSRFIKACRDANIKTIKHTDGNIMPILDQLIQAKPDAIHSLDPQGNVDIAEVKKAVNGEICLVGNVNCGLMQTGTDEEVKESCLYSLNNGMPDGGYIYATSNCIFTGMPLERYELMLKIRDEYGIY
jgi:uroporphyrinogen decarboxylase